MEATNLLKDLFSHMEWADALVWSTVQKDTLLLDDHLLHDRLYHTHFVQRVFLHVWRNEPLDYEEGKLLQGKFLAKWAHEYYRSEPIAFQELDNSKLDIDVHLPWASHFSQKLGMEFSHPSLGETIMQVVTHSAYHRGQANLRIRELGIEPPLTDFIAWVWSGKPQPSWPSWSK